MGQHGPLSSSQSSTQCDWQRQDKAVIIPYYPCPFVSALLHGQHGKALICLSDFLSVALWHRYTEKEKYINGHIVGQ